MIPPMRITYPADLAPEHRPIYLRGWNDRATAGAKRAASVTSEARANAARENAKKGGWPKGKKRGPRKPPAL